MIFNLITHNTRGVNDPESINKERRFLSLFFSKPDVVMIHEHKLRIMLLEFRTWTHAGLCGLDNSFFQGGGDKRPKNQCKIELRTKESKSTMRGGSPLDLGAITPPYAL